MTNTTVPLRSTEEAARTVGNNIKAALAERGHSLEWLAGEIGIDVQSILKAFSTVVPVWLTLDAAFYLNVPADRLLEGV